jgi:hypothetical protein
VFIDCEVRQGTIRDAILYSVGANANHGIRRTNADKRRSVLRLLNDGEWGKWSDRKIADQCGVSHTFVAQVRVGSSGNGCQIDDERKVERGGTVYTMKTATKKEPVTFGDINTDDEPTANDADERERKADAKQFVDDAPMLALAQAEAGRTFHGRKVPDDAPSLNLKEIRDNDPAVRWMRILSDLADCVSRLPDPSSLGQLPQEKRKYVNLRIGEIAATLQEVIK